MKKDALLTESKRNSLLKTVPNWSQNAKATSITRSFTFKDHLDALVFIARLTVHAQVENHHPDILFTYKKVKVTLTSHELKGLTLKDLALAKKFDQLKGGG